MQPEAIRITPGIERQLLVCRGTGCESQKADVIYDALAVAINNAGLADKIELKFTGCHGLCQMGPTVVIVPEGTFYCNVAPEDVPEIVDVDLVKGDKLERLLFIDPQSKEKESNCVFCGECVTVCPTGSLTYKQARFKGRPWELKKTLTTCTYCGVGCQLELNVKDNKVVKVTSRHDISEPNNGSLCVKGRFGYDFIDHPERLTSPLIKEQGSFREASWDEALDLIAKRFGTIKAKSGPDALAFSRPLAAPTKKTT